MPTIRGMNFYFWLISQKKRTDAVGDLAREVIVDKDWPRDKEMAVEANPNQSYRRCRQYVALQSGDSSPCMDALEQAVTEHKQAAPKVN